MTTCECGEGLTPTDKFCGTCGRPVARPNGADAVPVTGDVGASSRASNGNGRPRLPRSGAPSDERYWSGRLEFRASDSVEHEFLAGVDTDAMRARFRLGFVVGLLMALIGVVLAIPVGNPLAGLVVGLLLGGVASITVWCLPSSDLISEWGLTVVGAAPYADGTVQAVYESLKKHRLPEEVQVRRVREGTFVHTYMVTQTGNYTMFMGVRRYGDGLFLSWSLWRRESPILMLVRMFRESLSGLKGNAALKRWMSTQAARAMREAVHNAMHEGLTAATEGRAGDLAAAFNGHLPQVEDFGLDHGSNVTRI